MSYAVKDGDNEDRACGAKLESRESCLGPTASVLRRPYLSVLRPRAWPEVEQLSADGDAQPLSVFIGHGLSTCGVVWIGCDAAVIRGLHACLVLGIYEDEG